MTRAANAWEYTDPKVNVEVSSAAKLAVADLKGHRHPVIAVEGLVEALAAVGRELDVVGRGGSQQGGREQQLGCRDEMHGDATAERDERRGRKDRRRWAFAGQ